jgi:hypothetical protein
MRRCCAAVTVLTVVLMSLLLAGPASAGGPTSVLLADPTTRVAASLYYTDAEYETLAGLVGVNNPAAERRTLDEAGANHETGSLVTLTWLVHDVAVWRVDRVYVGGKGGPWIATQAVMNGSGNVYDSPVSWHKATDGPGLVALLEGLGFGRGSNASGSDAGAAVSAGNGSVQPVQPVTPTQPSYQASQPTSSTATWAGWVWGLAGLALGAALAAAASVLVPRARRPTTDPATAELTDDKMAAGQAEQTGPDEGSAWTAADELSWSGSPRG